MDVESYQAQLIQQSRLWRSLMLKATIYLDLRLSLLGICNKTLDGPLRQRVFTLIDHGTSRIWQHVAYRHGRRDSLDYALQLLGTIPEHGKAKHVFLDHLYKLDPQQR